MGHRATLQGHLSPGGTQEPHRELQEPTETGGLRRDPRQPRVTQGCHEGVGAPGESQGIPEDLYGGRGSKKHQRHHGGPRRAWGRWGIWRHPGGPQSTWRKGGTGRDPREPGGDGAPADTRGVPRGNPEKMRHPGGPRRACRRRDTCRAPAAPAGDGAGGAGVAPGGANPPGAGSAARHLGGSHRFGLLLGGEVVVESLGFIPGPPRSPGGARRLHSAAAPGHRRLRRLRSVLGGGSARPGSSRSRGRPGGTRFIRHPMKLRGFSPPGHGLTSSGPSAPPRRRPRAPPGDTGELRGIEEGSPAPGQSQRRGRRTPGSEGKGLGTKVASAEPREDTEQEVLGHPRGTPAPARPTPRVSGVWPSLGSTGNSPRVVRAGSWRGWSSQGGGSRGGQRCGGTLLRARVTCAVHWLMELVRVLIKALQSHECWWEQPQSCTLSSG